MVCTHFTNSPSLDSCRCLYNPSSYRSSSPVFCIYLLRCFTRQILPIQLAAKPGWCYRSSLWTRFMRTRLDLHLSSIVFFLDQALAGVTVESCTTSPTRDFYHAGPLPVDPIKIYSCNVTHFVTLPISEWYWCNVIYRVTTPETDRVYRKLGTKVRVIIQIRRQWDLNPRPLAWRSGNLTTTLRSPDLGEHFFYFILNMI